MLSSADILQMADVIHQVVLFLFIGLPMAKPNRKMEALVCAAKRQQKTDQITFPIPPTMGNLFQLLGGGDSFKNKIIANRQTYTEN